MLRVGFILPWAATTWGKKRCITRVYGESEPCSTTQANRANRKQAGMSQRRDKPCHLLTAATQTIGAAAEKALIRRTSQLPISNFIFNDSQSLNTKLQFYELLEDFSTMELK